MATENEVGSAGERDVQDRFGTRERAERFYEGGMHRALTDRMREFVADRIMFFLGTADRNGETDVSPRFGPRGFVNVLDPGRVAWPEYRGNGVSASLGNMTENPNATLTFIDWWETTVGLHVNGAVCLHEDGDLSGARDLTGGDRTKVWVELDVAEAYIHCAKHVPRLEIAEFDPPWGTDDDDVKRTGYFAEEDR